MKITREQYKKRQSEAPEGWNYDLNYALIHSEHTVKRTIRITDTKYVVAHMMYNDELEVKTNEYGCKWRVETGRQIPTLHVSIYTVKPLTDVGTSHGLGVWHDLKNEVQKNKNYKTLCKLAATFTDEDILSIAKLDTENSLTA